MMKLSSHCCIIVGTAAATVTCTEPLPASLTVYVTNVILKK